MLATCLCSPTTTSCKPSQQRAVTPHGEHVMLAICVFTPLTTYIKTVTGAHGGSGPLPGEQSPPEAPGCLASRLVPIGGDRVFWALGVRLAPLVNVCYLGLVACWITGLHACVRVYCWTCLRASISKSKFVQTTCAGCLRAQSVWVCAGHHGNYVQTTCAGCLCAQSVCVCKCNVALNN